MHFMCMHLCLTLQHGLGWTFVRQENVAQLKKSNNGCLHVLDLQCSCKSCISSIRLPTSANFCHVQHPLGIQHDIQLCYISFVKFYRNWTINKRVIHISSNEVPSLNQLTLGGVIHKLIYMFKPFNLINMG